MVGKQLYDLRCVGIFVYICKCFYTIEYRNQLEAKKKPGMMYDCGYIMGVL